LKGKKHSEQGKMVNYLFLSTAHRNMLTGWLLFSSIFAALGNAIFHLSPLPAGMLQLAVAILLFERVSIWVKLQSLILATAGVGILLWTETDLVTLIGAFTKNRAMIAMLAAVGFLRLVVLPTGVGDLPRGRRALWQTLFGVHWLGSVVNISAVVLFGDRMSGTSGRLTSAQAAVLVRGFALAALWSPFFVAIGMAFSQAPGAQLAPVILWGLPISQGMMAFMAFKLQREISAGGLEFSGYPFTHATMVGPLLLALMVILAHLLVPQFSIVGLVTIAAPLYAVFACRRNKPLRLAAKYIRLDLPRMGAEVLLFLSAGIFGAGFMAFVSQHSLVLPLTGNPPFDVALGLAIIIILAAVGIHPIAGITVVGTILSHVGIAPDLLAICFLMGWGLGVIICPISGTNLLLDGRFGVSIGQVWRHNALFVFCAYLVCCGWMFLFTHFA
jgi:hypothetical protein